MIPTGVGVVCRAGALVEVDGAVVAADEIDLTVLTVGITEGMSNSTGRVLRKVKGPISQVAFWKQEAYMITLGVACTCVINRACLQ